MTQTDISRKIVPSSPPGEPDYPQWKLRDYFTFNVDHKLIGIQYMVMGFFFYLVGGAMAVAMRTELRTPDPDFVDPTLYNALLTNHGTIMIFLWVIPVTIGGFGNYFIPLMIGARDMAFPKLNALAFWLNPPAAMLLAASFIYGGAQAGWTSYPPLSEITAPKAQVMWIVALILIGSSSIMGSLNFLITMWKMRVPSLPLMKMPLFCWAIIAASLIGLIGTPPLTIGLLLLAFDILFGTSFYKPDAGGSVVLYQHLFWFYSHPAVYLMVLPVFGVISEVIPVHARKPIFGYTAIAFASLAICFVGLFVWVHHMFTSATAPWMRMFFTISTLFVAVPTGVKIFGWIATLWGGKIRYTSAMLFAVGLLSMFVFGGITGVMLAAVPFDLHVHDSYFIVGHFHYVLFGGSVFGIYAGIYHWFPKITGRMLDERLGKIHFVMTFFGTHLTFLPMHNLGLSGMPRRIALYDPQFQSLNQLCTWGAYLLALSIVPFYYNVINSWIRGERAGANPWRALTMEWTTDSPPMIENWEVLPVMTTGPYDYGKENETETVIAPTETTAP
jgi:cytochrome c oxidase subunit I